MKTLFAALAFTLPLTAEPALALGPGDRIDNFRLLDQRGASHELYCLSDAKAVVLMTHGNGCSIVRNALPTLREIRDRYRARGVEVLLLDSNLQDSRDAIAQEAGEFEPGSEPRRALGRADVGRDERRLDALSLR